MQLFISYKRENEAFARLVRENLLAWGYAVWMDIFDIPKGSYWPDEIDKGLRASDVIIGILSPQAVESRNVKNEWDWAIVNGRQLILLLHAQTDVPMNYVSLNYINCVGTAQSDGISQLQSALQSKPSALTAPSDLFRDYLQKLYDRINRYLGQKILATLRTDEGMPEPLRLTGASTPEAVEGLFSRQPQIDPLFAIGGIEDDPTPPDKFTDFQQALDHFKGRVLLLGEPGAGKTITLLHTARDAVVRRLQDPTQPLPILGIIPTWDADNKTPIAEWLVASDPILRNPLPMFGEGQGVGSIIQQGRALLLLDGLDELGGERPVDPKNPEGEKFDPRQRFLEALPTNNQILVTCRRQDYVEIGSKAKLNGAITLQPLSEAQIAAYLRGTQALWQAVQNDDGLREMAKTPLLLSFFAFAYQDHPEEAEQLTNLADSPGDLRDAIFERYVRERYEHEARKLRMRGEEMAYSLAATCDILSYLAATSLKNTFLQSENERVENQFGRWEIEFVPQSVVGEPVDVDEFVKQAISINLLFSSEPHWLHFTHLLLRDYFAWAPLFVVVNESWDVVSRAKAVWSLGQISDSRSVEALLQILTNSKEPYNLRKVAATALGNFKDVRAVDALIDVLNNSYLDTDSAYIGDAAASSLGIIGDVRAIALLVRALDHPYPVIWEYAEKALIRMGAPAIDALIHVLLQEPAIRFWGNQIGRVLTQIGIPAIDPLVQALDRMEGMAKYYAVDALCNIGTPALDALRNHFHHFSPETKKQIISSLPRTTDPQVLSILEMALNDKDRKVREKSQDSLEGMGTPEAATLLKKYPYKKNRRQRRLRRGPSL